MDDFQMGWNYAGKGLDLPLDCTEEMVEGYEAYLYGAELVDEGMAS
jgi:hypothetical protein